MEKKIGVISCKFFLLWEKHCFEIISEWPKIQFILLVHMGYKSVVYKRSRWGAQSAYELLC